jgi:hypothetical protein
MTGGAGLCCNRSCVVCPAGAFPCGAAAGRQLGAIPHRHVLPAALWRSVHHRAGAAWQDPAGVLVAAYSIESASHLLQAHGGLPVDTLRSALLTGSNAGI